MSDDGPRPAVPRPSDPADLELSRRLARVMDDLIVIPGTKVGIGFDALIGLIPGFGDLAGSALSGAIMFQGVRRRVPVIVLARMSWNLIIDALIGLIPGVGDVLDVAHRANRKNLRLLERSVEANPDPDPPTVGYVAAALVVTVIPLLVVVALAVISLVVLWRWLT